MIHKMEIFAKLKELHNNKSQICYCGQISLQSSAAKCSFLTPLGDIIYFAGDGTYYMRCTYTHNK